jgi:phenylacetate-CoA ligase
VRYRTRDISRLTREPCPCGRTHARILRVTGRGDDMLIIRGVNVYPSQIEAVLVGLPGIAPHYQLVLSRDGALDTMVVEVEEAPGTDPASRPKTAAAVMNQIKSRLGVSCTVNVKGTGEVPRSQGKAVRVKDLRNKN